VESSFCDRKCAINRYVTRGEGIHFLTAKWLETQGVEVIPLSKIRLNFRFLFCFLASAHKYLPVPSTKLERATGGDLR